MKKKFSILTIALFFASITLILFFQNCSKISLVPITQSKILPSALAKWNLSSKQIILEDSVGVYYSYDLTTNSLTNFGNDQICLGGSSGPSPSYYCQNKSLLSDVDGDGVNDWIRWNGGLCQNMDGTINTNVNFGIQVMSKAHILKTSTLPCSISVSNVPYESGEISVLPAPLQGVASGFIVNYFKPYSSDSLSYVYSVAADGSIALAILQPTIFSTTGNSIYGTNGIFAEDSGALDYLNFNLSGITFSIVQNYFQSQFDTISQKLSSAFCSSQRCRDFISWLHTNSGKPNLVFTNMDGLSQNKATYSVYDSTLAELSTNFDQYAFQQSGSGTDLIARYYAPIIGDFDGDGNEDPMLFIDPYTEVAGKQYLGNRYLDYYLASTNYSKNTINSQDLLTKIQAYPGVGSTYYQLTVTFWPTIYTNNELNAKVLLSLYKVGGSSNATAAIYDVKNQKILNFIKSPDNDGFFYDMIPLQQAK